MITGLDHITVAMRDADAAAESYRRLLGREPEIQDGTGVRRAWFRFPNMALEVIGPHGEGPSGDRLRVRLETVGEGLWLLGFSVPDVEDGMRLLNRRGLSMAPVGALRPVALGPLDGVTVALVTDRGAPMSPPVGDEAAAVASLDHVVVRTPNPDRALATYGARLGLDLRLDRENPQWGARQLFFRCGDAVIEVGASLKAPASDGPDRLDGLAWRVTDPDAVHARLTREGFNVSELRTGRKPGTKVFTVREAPSGASLGGVPTLMIQQNAEPVSA
jgi:catechol 2,3-dioxygenase-like lactoylglutathione lyase family enzyme